MKKILIGATGMVLGSTLTVNALPAHADTVIKLNSTPSVATVYASSTTTIKINPMNWDVMSWSWTQPDGSTRRPKCQPSRNEPYTATCTFDRHSTPGQWRLRVRGNLDSNEIVSGETTFHIKRNTTISSFNASPEPVRKAPA